jgi:3-deoxy-D-manno-octulosonate 8-phosphate phosphatase (KDO 8-P phosphatase)
MTAQRVRLFVTDNDGTMTDGMMYYDHLGNVTKGYHTRDVTALWRLQYVETVQVLVLTGSNHDCDRHRYRFLEDGDFDVAVASLPARPDSQKHLIQGVPYDNKPDVMEDLLKRMDLTWDEVAYIGDAANDLVCVQRAGMSACPHDAEPVVKANVKYISPFDGGRFAVEDFARMVVTHNVLLDRKENRG